MEIDRLREKLQEEKEEKSIHEEKLGKLSKRSFIIRFFKRKEIKMLNQKIDALDQMVDSSNKMVNKALMEVEEIKEEIKKNEDDLISLCGLDISEYNLILEEVKGESLTKEEITIKLQMLEEKIRNLQIEEKEQYLDDLCKKNGIVRDTLEKTNRL